MNNNLPGSRIYCFNPSSEKESQIRNRTIYHYTSPEGLLSILKTPSIRFTDCQYLNDKSEYNHIHLPLEEALKQIRDSIYDANLCDMIQHYIDDRYDYHEIVTDNPDLGLKGLKMVNMRHYVFCASTDNDLLHMWNYYVKGGDYRGYSIGMSVKEITNSLSSITDNRVKFFFGPIIYGDKEKIETLKKAIIATDKKLHESLNNAHNLEDRDIVTQEIYGELLLYIENYRLFFKDAVFSNEKEYRYVIRMPQQQLDKSNNVPNIGYSIKQGIVTPHCDIPLKKDSVIKKITIAPMMEDTLAEAGLRRYLLHSGYPSEIEIDKSQVPIRY